MLEQLKQRACAAIDRHADELKAAADWIHAHPEIGHQEVQAAQRLSDLLRAAGLVVEMGTAGMATAFKAELPGKGAARPRVAILAEYDALPGLGHGCGHNLIGTSAIGAGLALRRSWATCPARCGCSARQPKRAPRRTRAAKCTWSTRAFSRTSTPRSCSTRRPRRS